MKEKIINWRIKLKSLFNFFASFSVGFVISLIYSVILLLLPVNLWIYIAFIITIMGLGLLISDGDKETWKSILGGSLGAIPTVFYILLFLLKNTPYTVS